MIINLKEHLYLLSIVTAMLVTSACSRSELFKAELACSKGDGKACVTAANIYKNGEDSTGKKIVADLDKARSFFIKACDNHEGSVCNEIGKELSSPNRKDVDFVAATEFFEKGCNVNNYEACTILGCFMRALTSLDVILISPINILLKPVAVKMLEVVPYLALCMKKVKA